MNLSDGSLYIEKVCSNKDLSAKRAHQIIESSKQSHILDNTPKDATERFVSQTSILNRLVSPHLMLLLVDKNNDELAGLSWFRPTEQSPVPDTQLTYAHRLYEHHTGRGLSIPFARASHQIAREQYGEVNVWLETRIDNTPAVRTYEAIGYRTHSINEFTLRMSVQLNQVTHE